VAAYAPPPAVSRILLANPSTYVLPSLDEAAPYGFGGMPEGLNDAAAIEAYLAAPITIYLGQDDVGEKDLTRNDFADRQGSNRLDRGRNVFTWAQETAETNGWPFGWILVEAPGVGHTARGMLEADALIEALGFAGEAAGLD